MEALACKSLQGTSEASVDYIIMRVQFLLAHMLLLYVAISGECGGMYNISVALYSD